MFSSGEAKEMLAPSKPLTAHVVVYIFSYRTLKCSDRHFIYTLT